MAREISAVAISVIAERARSGFPHRTSMKFSCGHIFVLGAIAALASCAAPRAEVVEMPKKETPKEESAESAVGPVFGSPANDGLRPPSDLLAMPADEELRSVRPTGPGSQPSGIIVRPPGEESTSTGP